MKIKYPLFAVLLVCLSAVLIYLYGGWQALKNHRAYPVWTTTEIHGETIDREPFGDIFVNVDYDLIKSLPLDIKKIIAYYSARA